MKLMAVCGCVVGGSCTTVELRKGRGNNRGLFSLSVLVGRLILLFLSLLRSGGGGVGGLLCGYEVWCWSLRLKRAGDATNNSRLVGEPANSGEVVVGPALPSLLLKTAGVQF